MELARKYLCLLPVFSLFLGSYSCLETHTVTTPQGDIIGFTKSVVVKDEERTLRRYLGIPFAKPPVGNFRFMKPEEPERFTEPFEALKFGNACPQMVFPLFPIYEEMSEDCLYLNVFVPVDAPKEPTGLPVMVFVHGGGFAYGTGNAYISDVLASTGNVIVVTINYRLALLGFFSTKDKKVPGNAGLWDQHLAFIWVNKNIAGFGGDPSRVTIFGESAGAASVLLQALYPGNKGLFQRVIAESGSALMTALYREDQSPNAAALAEAFNCDVDDIVNCINQLNSSQIIDRYTEIATESPMKMYAMSFRPTVDGELLKRTPYEIKASEDTSEELVFFRSLDIINGVTNDEGAFLATYLSGSNDTDAWEPTREVMNTQLVPSSFMLYSETEQPTDFVKKLMISEYTNWSNPDDPHTIRAEYSRMLGDMVFNVGAIEQTRLHCDEQTKGRNYFFIFGADTSASFIKKPKWSKGAIHGEELGFVFGFDEGMLVHLNFTQENDPRRNMKDWERDLTDRIMRYWANFAAYGNPNGQEGEVTEWPQYDLESQKAYFFSEEDSVMSYPYARSVDFWSNVIPAAMDASTSSNTADSEDSTDSETGSCSADGDCDKV